MSQPSQKDAGMERVITALTGVDRRGAIYADVCVPPPIGCGKPTRGFRDDLYAKEYTISGLCQSCQDEVFG